MVQSQLIEFITAKANPNKSFEEAITALNHYIYKADSTTKPINNSDEIYDWINNQLNYYNGDTMNYGMITYDYDIIPFADRRFSRKTTLSTLLSIFVQYETMEQATYRTRTDDTVFELWIDGNTKLSSGDWYKNSGCYGVVIKTGKQLLFIAECNINKPRSFTSLIHRVNAGLIGSYRGYCAIAAMRRMVLPYPADLFNEQPYGNIYSNRDYVNFHDGTVKLSVLRLLYEARKNKDKNLTEHTKGGICVCSYKFNTDKLLVISNYDTSIFEIFKVKI